MPGGEVLWHSAWVHAILIDDDDNDCGIMVAVAPPPLIKTETSHVQVAGWLPLLAAL